jgi:hypothetical protein
VFIRREENPKILLFFCSFPVFFSCSLPAFFYPCLVSVATFSSGLSLSELRVFFASKLLEATPSVYEHLVFCCLLSQKGIEFELPGKSQRLQQAKAKRCLSDIACQST